MLAVSRGLCSVYSPSFIRSQIADVGKTGQKHFMDTMRQMFSILSLAAFSSLLACSSADPVSRNDIKHYTGIELCSLAHLTDLTTSKERDATPGFSFHVRLGLDAKCADDFERQLAALSPPDCAGKPLQPSGCFVRDAYAVAGKHTSIMVKPVATGQYDVRFYE